MKENIEEAVEILEHIKEYMQKNIDDGINKFIYNEQGFDEKCIDIINAINEILSDNKRVLKENEKLKKQNYDLLRKLKNRVKEVRKLEKYSMYKKEFSTLNKKVNELQKENKELKEKWDKDTHKLQNDLDIANAKIIELKQELMEGLYANRK